MSVRTSTRKTANPRYRGEGYRYVRSRWTKSGALVTDLFGGRGGRIVRARTLKGTRAQQERAVGAWLAKRNPAQRLHRRNDALTAAIVGGIGGALGTHAVHKAIGWAQKRKTARKAAAKTKARGGGAKRAAGTTKPAAPAQPAVLNEVASALRNLGYKAPQAKQMAEQAWERTKSTDFDALFRSAMAGAKKNPAGRGKWLGKVGEYQLRTRDGRSIRKATKVTYPDGTVVKFLDKVPANKARAQAAEQLRKERPKSNPAQASARAQRIFKMFAGRPSTQTAVRRTAARLPGSNFAKIGDLVSLTVGNRKVSFDTDKTQPIVVTDAKAKRLFFLGGNQDLRALPAQRKANPGGLADMGTVAQIEYFARKKCDDFRPVVYFHNFGEDNGKQPRLMWDPKAKQMYLAGGDYKIKNVGIVN